jgi:protein ImuB
MCVYLPAWPLQRLQRGRPELRNKPVVLATPFAGRGPQVVLCTKQAARFGIRPGMPVAEAVALHRHVAIEEQDTEQDREDLQRLAVWAERYSPIVGLEDPSPLPLSPKGRGESLLLDVTGCAACFGGEDRLLQRAAHEFREQGWLVRLALADTLGAAWALAHYSVGRIFNPSVGSDGLKIRPTELGPLPPAALRLPEETVYLLAQLGIDRIDALLALPRTAIPARFGSLVLQRLDQALGRMSEVIVSHRLPPDIEAAFAFEPPTPHLAVLNQALEHLLEQVHQTLQARGRGARHIECQLSHEIAPPERIELGLVRASACPKHLGMLFRTRLEQVKLAEPVSELKLRVLQAEPLAIEQSEFFADELPLIQERLAGLIDRLSNRLGKEAVTRVLLVPDCQPEYACRFEPMIGSPAENKRRSDKSRLPIGDKTVPEPPPVGPRPVQLWRTPVRIEVMSAVPEGPPLRFRWAGEDYRVIRSWGPERIETGWWRGADIHRDYYIAATERGQRFWVFRTRQDGRWFLHGCFE